MRLSYIEPKDVTDDLINLIKSEEKLCKHLHIPFQSGDDEILKRMKRPYTAGDYISIADRLRKVIPEIAISTDIMVGFPGEEEARFQNTLNFIKEISNIIHCGGERHGTLYHKRIWLYERPLSLTGTYAFPFYSRAFWNCIVKTYYMIIEPKFLIYIDIEICTSDT